MKQLALLFVLASCGSSYYTTRDGTRATVEYVEAHGIKVAPNGHPVDRAELEAVVEATLSACEHVLGSAVRETVRPKMSSSDTYLVFREHPFPCGKASPTGLCSGLYEPYSTMIVGFVSPLADSAVANELTHLLLCRLNNLCGEDAHEFAEKNGLPVGSRRVEP